MPTKPNPQELNASSGEILNAIRNDLGGTYAENVPAVAMEGDESSTGARVTAAESLQSLRAVGAALDTFSVHRNQFLDHLVNRIGRVIISSRLYRNPWSAFKRGYLEFGESIEEIFVQMAKSEQYQNDQDGATVFKRRLPDVRTRFHSMNYQKKYPITVSRVQLKTAFLSWDGITDLLSKIVESVYSGANLDEFVMMKYTCANAILNGRTAVQTVPAASLANADQVVSSMRELSLNLQYVSSSYNEAGVDTYTDPNYQYVIMTNAFASKVDVGSLARAFNLEYVQFMGHTVGVNSFAFNAAEERRLIDLLYPKELGAQPDSVFTEQQNQLLESVSCLVIDSNWFMIFDTFEDMTSIQDPEALSWNYFYHTWKLFSTSPFANAVALTTQTPAVTKVTITPTSVAAGTIPATGGSVQLKAAVAGTGLYNQSVTWSVSDSKYCSISDTGLLSVKNYSADTATSITCTVTATSVQDPSKKATCVVTLK